MSDEFIQRHITVLGNDSIGHDYDTENTIGIDETVNLEEEKEKILRKIEMEARSERKRRRDLYDQPPYSTQSYSPHYNTYSPYYDPWHRMNKDQTEQFEEAIIKGIKNVTDLERKKKINQFVSKFIFEFSPRQKNYIGKEELILVNKYFEFISPHNREMLKGYLKGLIIFYSYTDLSMLADMEHVILALQTKLFNGEPATNSNKNNHEFLANILKNKWERLASQFCTPYIP